TVSLFFLSIAVVGGLQSIGGAIASAIVFSGLNELFFRVEALAGWLDVVSAGLLAFVLIFYPGGLARVPDAIAPVLARVANAFRSMRAGATPGGVEPALATSGAGIVGSGREAAGAFLRRLGRELRGFGRELAASRESLVRSAEERAPAGWRPRVRAFGAQLRGLGSEARAVAADARAAVRRGARIAQGAEIETSDVTRADSLAPLLGGATPETTRAPLAEHNRIEGALLAAEEVTVRFGGLVAVGGATLAVRRGEIVGLIGPNGAGKTTMFNAMAGFVRPAKGRIMLDGDDVTPLSVHERAARGVGRTFQAIQLATELTVRENLLVATHVRNLSGFLSHLVVGRRSALAEMDAAARVAAAARLLDIEDVLDRPAAGLPFGTLRMVELARALVTGSPLIMLDEPASGLDDTETQRFAGIVRAMRDELGISILLIEHDVALVMSLCDYVYVLDRGVPIADGTPKRVQSHPAVIAAYLGGGGAEPAVEPEVEADLVG
ncbi:MAG: ATP-binding cassette domain-containing protein, partial [Vicinamibacteria bacterium]